MLPKLRRSLQKNESNRKSPVLVGSASGGTTINGGANGGGPLRKSGSALEAPQAVIRALYDYAATSSEELSFSQGDFFHVVGSDADPNW